MLSSYSYTEGLTGTCVAENRTNPPHVIVVKDHRNNYQIASMNKEQDENSSCVMFVLGNVTGTCVIRCHIFQVQIEKNCFSSN